MIGAGTLLVLLIAITLWQYAMPKPSVGFSGIYFNQSNVTILTNQSSDGYTLYEGQLIDMQGAVVQRWNFSYLSVLDSTGYYYGQAYFEAPLWGKFTFNDTPVWTSTIPIHHEIYPTVNGTVIALGKEVQEYNGRLIEFDTILEFDENGTLIDNFSIWNAFEQFKQFHKPTNLDSPSWVELPDDHARENASVWGAKHDYYHMNSLSVIPKNAMQGVHPAFNPGNLLISFRHGNMLFILDRVHKNITWLAIDDQVKDGLQGQHAPVMDESGSIFVLDNGRYRQSSRILRINPVTLSILWEYSAPNFFTLSQGYLQLLPNGNLLVTQSEQARVFELTPNKTIAWEFFDTTKGVDEDATPKDIYRATRYTREIIDELLSTS
jgi:hypothetical protein